MLSDRQGFVWFGTMSGLNRFDGYNFKVFRNKSGNSTSLIDNYIQHLYLLPDEKIWVMTRDLPSIYNSRTEKFDNNVDAYLKSIGLPAGSVISVVNRNSDRYWFLYDSLGLFFHAKNRSTNFLRGRISAMAETKDKSIWVIHRNGLLQKYDPSSGKLLVSSNTVGQYIPQESSFQLFEDNDGDLWIWTANAPNGLIHFDVSSNKTIYFSEKAGNRENSAALNNTGVGKNQVSNLSFRLSSNLITGLIQDDKGLIWAATDHGGINLIDKKKNYSIRYLKNDPKDNRSLAQNSITNLLKDDNGVIWVGTFKQGISYVNEKILKFQHYHHSDANASGLPFDDVNRFVEDRSGNLWIGTNGGGLIYFDRKNNSFRQFLHQPGNPNSISNNVIVSLLIDHTNKLWIGTYFGGLSSYDGKNFVHYRHDPSNHLSLSDDRVWEIFEDSNNQLWVGTLNGGLDLMDRTSGTFKHHQANPGGNGLLQSNYISALLEDRSGNLWIATAIGVTVFEKGKSKPVQYNHSNDKNSLSNDNVISLFEDSKGRIWIGTREGLNLFNAESKNFAIYTTENGLPDNAILNILEDDRKSLWISTPNGLCKVRFENNSLSVINYDEINNLQGREFNENAALRTSTGELIFGGPSGFNIIDPDKSSVDATPDKIVFTDFQIQNKSIVPGSELNGRVILDSSLNYLDELVLKHKENVFSIEFSSLNFPHGSRDRYAYLLEDFNKDWLYTDGSQRRVTYTNLDPGNYVFRVKVLGSDGNWSEERSIKIKIEPPFWRSPLAFLLYVIGAIAILILARKITLDRAHMRFEVAQQKTEAERVQALDQLKTKFFTNVSHEFRTPLSLILSPLDQIIKQISDPDQKKQLHLVQRNAKRLLNLVNQLLDFRKMEVQEIKLYPAIGDIIQFIKDISYSFTDISEKKGIEFSVESEIESLEIYFDRDKMEKILFNLLSNAFKYTPDNGKVKVQLRIREEGNEKRLPTALFEQHSNLQHKEKLDAGNHENFLELRVSDSGIGIPADKHELIFERFFQNEVPQTMVNQGSGIGLAITKEFVKLHNGTISVDSEPGRGTTFIVLIPAVKINVLPVSSIDAQFSQGGNFEIESELTGAANLEEYRDHSEESGAKRKKTILVVEDNEDLRFYLKDNLKSQYHVVEAVNGKEGWEKAKQISPDLVVSDVMMPLMDGMELAKKLRSDTITAHIPVILLTAVGNTDKQVEAYKLGISDYITKPFTFEILESRINNLFDQQKLLQKKFQKQIEVNPSEITVTPLDEQFITQALQVVEKNMDNPDFSVEDLSREMLMSRVGLYKKILSLTGRSPLEFIRSIRLKRAAQLLEKSGKSVSEIAYEVGFNNPKVFTKYFKEEFKKLPSQYRVNI
jgi:signal transduction histidine kinase/ligand-binding sensor domain-containing protein/DNA-binding response OmpR family regulator